MKIIIPGTLPALNEMLNAAKRNKYTYEKLKNDAIAYIDPFIYKSIKRQKAPDHADYEIIWYCPNKRRDKDNIMAGQKFIYDALQETGVIPNDGWRQIGSITHRFAVDRLNPRIEVIITEARSDAHVL